MASTSITTSGGMVVITQVIPQGEKATPLQAAPNAMPAPPPKNLAPPPAPTKPTKMDDMTTTFLRGGPQSLGIVQIFIGVMCILFSLTALSSSILLGHAPFCLAVSFIVSGSLAVSASRRTSVNLVCVCLSWTLISVLVGVAGVVYLSFLLAESPASVRLCEDCQRVWVLDMVVYGSLGLLMVLLVLQICVSVTVCVFSVKALRRCRRGPAPVTVMVNGGSSPLCAAASQYESDVPLLDGEGDKPRP